MKSFQELAFGAPEYECLIDHPECPAYRGKAPV